MTRLEKLYDEAYNQGIEIYDFLSKGRIHGLYCDGTIALSKTDTPIQKTCVLAEELGHHYTTSGDILDLTDVSNRKQEYRARLWAYNKMIGLSGIISSYKAGCRTIEDMADYLDVTEDFLLEALKCYRSKYGLYTQFDNYVIYFEPSVGVFKLI